MHPITECVAARLRDLRLRDGLNQTLLACRMQERGHRWHQSTVAKIETGARPLQLDEAAALAEIFGMPLSSLLGETAEQAASDERTAIEKAIRVQIAAEITGRPEVAALCPAPWHLNVLRCTASAARARRSCTSASPTASSSGGTGIRRYSPGGTSCAP